MCAYFRDLSSAARTLSVYTHVQVKALIECKRLQPLAMPDEAAGGGMSLRQVAGGALLSAEMALMWHIVCTWLQVCSAAFYNPVKLPVAVTACMSLTLRHILLVPSLLLQRLCTRFEKEAMSHGVGRFWPVHCPVYAMHSWHAGGRERQGASSGICQRGSSAS